MKGKITTIKPDGTETVTEFDRIAKLADLKKAIGGGTVEIIPEFVTFRGDDCVAICDDNGKYKNLRINFVAQGYWLVSFNRTVVTVPQPINDVLCGDIAVITGDAEFMDAL
jgi:hypothetical protein